ncbi:LysR family transcriptional regulator [Alcaligenes sp. WGS1538]|uniref:LysR family transcriptional regulator n=1 Tax=Alcaligenes sp. WGS1538 TaxID=3366811 RepID=UPI00372D6C98
MDVRSLRYFIETVKHQSFTQAAQSLSVTQSTVSKMVRQLEDEVGEPLLIRDHRQLQLTDCGKVVLERGQEVLQSVQRLLREVHEVQALQRGRLELGMPPMINVLFTEVLKAFKARHPRIELVLHEETGMGIERMVAAGAVEMGLSILPLGPELNLSAAPVARHGVWAIGRKNSFRSAQGKVKLEELERHPLIFLSDDFALTRMLRRAFAHAGLQPHIAAQSGQWDWVASMAQAGMGIALLPQPFLSRLESGDWVAAEIVEPALNWEVALLWNGRYLSQAAKAWLQVCADVLGGSWPGLDGEA